MMRDPKYTAIWLDNVVHQPFPPGDIHSFVTSPTSKALPSLMMPAKVDNGDQQRQSLAKLRELPITAVLLLFTPVVVPYGFLNYDQRANKPYEATKARIQQIDTDPFEHLGRALGKRYRRVRHVPYLPNIGMTATHEAFMSQADGVVVVTAEPEPKAAGRGSDAAVGLRDNLEKQADFAECVAEHLLASKGDGADFDSLAVNLHFGSEQRMPAGLDALESVWVADKYTAAAVKRALRLVLGTPES